MNGKPAKPDDSEQPKLVLEAEKAAGLVQIGKSAESTFKSAAK